jgi:CheY-like chemotaxis protein
MSKILVVDDEEQLLTLVKAILEGNGYEVQTATNGPEALDILEKEEFDLVLLDVMMPEMDGWTVAGKIKNRPSIKNVPVVMLTVKTMSPQYFYSKEAEGILDYINKPFSKKELLVRVGKVFETISKVELMKGELKHVAAQNLIEEYEDLLMAERLYENLKTSLDFSLAKSEKDTDNHKLIKDAKEYGEVLLDEVKKKKKTYDKFIKDL